MRRHIAALCAGLALVACGSNPIRAPYPGTPAAQAVRPGPQAQASDPVRQEKIFLERLYGDPRLDPIRDKVPLQLRADAVQSGYLRINTRPNAREKEAIKAWLEVRERAQQYQLEVRGPPSAELARTRARVTQTIMQLQTGKMTYSAFAARMQELDAQYQQQSHRHKIGSNP